MRPPLIIRGGPQQLYGNPPTGGRTKTETPRRGGEPKRNALRITRDTPRDQPTWDGLTTWSPCKQGRTRHMGTPPMGTRTKTTPNGVDMTCPLVTPTGARSCQQNCDTLKGALQSTPSRGDTERNGVSTQSVPRQAVTPNPYSGGGSMTAINPVRAYKAPRSGPVEGARRARIGGGTA